MSTKSNVPQIVLNVFNRRLMGVALTLYVMSISIPVIAWPSDNLPFSPALLLTILLINWLVLVYGAVRVRKICLLFPPTRPSAENLGVLSLVVTTITAVVCDFVRAVLTDGTGMSASSATAIALILFPIIIYVRAAAVHLNLQMYVMRGDGVVKIVKVHDFFYIQKLHVPETFWRSTGKPGGVFGDFSEATPHGSLDRARTIASTNDFVVEVTLLG